MVVMPIDCAFCKACSTLGELPLVERPIRMPVVQDIFFEPDTFLDGLGDIILHNFLISLVQRYDISEMKLAFDEIFKLSLLSPFQSAEESEEYAFFNIESSLLGI